MRVEQTEKVFGEVEGEIRNTLHEDVAQILDNIGLPGIVYNMAFGDSATTSMADGEILVTLNGDRRKPPRWR